MASLSGVSRNTTTIELKGIIDRITKDHLVSITAETAMGIRNKVQARGSFPKDEDNYLTIVDRKHGHDREYNVRPGGRIEYHNNASTIQEVVEWIWRRLKKFSPVLDGVYKVSHRILIDGKDIRGPGGSSLSKWSEGELPKHYKWDRKSQTSVVTFVNDVVYARRIEAGGWTGKRFKKPWSSKTPRGGVYKAVARAAKIRFGQTVRIDFRYTKLASKRQISFFVHEKSKRPGKLGQVLQGEQMYPSIRVRARSTTKGATLQ